MIVAARRGVGKARQLDVCNLALYLAAVLVNSSSFEYISSLPDNAVRADNGWAPSGGDGGRMASTRTDR